MWDTDAPRDRRSLRSDDRGVSPVVGAILMVALAVLLVSLLQTTAIPALNAQTEYQHSQEVESDVVRLDGAVDRVAATGAGETATVTTGLRYPPRLLFINPPPPSGTLRTTDSQSVTIANAEASGETGDYWNGSDRTFATTTLVYSPAYNEYDSAPTTVYEPWAVYTRLNGRTAPLTETDLIDGRQISLVTLDGEFDGSRAGAVPVNVDPTSAPVETVTVGNDTAPVTLTLSTGLRNDTWTELLADELDPTGTDPDRYVTSIECAQEPPDPCGQLTLTLEPGTYDLRLGEVSLGSGASQEDAVYLTDVEGDETSVPATGRQRIVVEARDRFDNPVSGVRVDATLGADNGTLRAVSPVTGTDGRAVFVYEAPDTASGTQPVTVTTQFGTGDRQRTVTFDLQVFSVGGGAAAGPTSASLVEGVAGSVDSRNIAGGGRGREASFSISASESVTITGFSVTTQNDLDGRPFVDRDTTFDGTTLPVTVGGEIQILLRDIDASNDLAISQFVDPASPEADIVVVLEFADGSTVTLGLG